MESAGFCTEHSAKARGIGYEEERSPTLRAGVVPATVSLENHPTDGRIKICEDDTVQTLTSRMGTGGMNVPLLMKIRSGCEGGGKGALVQDDKSATLSCNNDQTLFEPRSWDGGQISPTLTANNSGGNQRMPDKDNFNCVLQMPFGICSDKSNSMLSDNPNSGIYEAETSKTIDCSGGNPACNQGGIAVVSVDQGGGKSSCSVSEELSPTLSCTHGGEPAVCVPTAVPFTQNQRNEVRILGNKSGAICKAATKQQTFVLQGSMIGRKDENGPQGDGINEDVSFTLNTTDRHAVYAMTTGNYAQVEEEQSPTLLARDYKDPTIINEPSYGIGRDTFNQGKNAKFAPSVSEEVQPTMVAKGPGAVAEPYGFYPQMKAEGMSVSKDKATTLVNGTNPGFQNGVVSEYSVRRLTPTECARLQGFPDWWCSGLETDTPSEDEVYFWRDIWETHRRIIGNSAKPKTDKQLIKWLKAPYSDAAEYKMWGNGVALPCVFFVLAGIVWANNNSTAL